MQLFFFTSMAVFIAGERSAKIQHTMPESGFNCLGGKKTSTHDNIFISGSEHRCCAVLPDRQSKLISSHNNIRQT